MHERDDPGVALDDPGVDRLGELREDVRSFERGLHQRDGGPGRCRGIQEDLLQRRRQSVPTRSRTRSSRRFRGIGRASPVARVSPRNVARAISNAKNGFPPDVSAKLVSAGGGNPTPRRVRTSSDSSSTVSGTSESRVMRSSGNARASPSGSAAPTPRVAINQPTGLLAEPSNGELQRANGRDVEPLDVVERDEDGTAGRRLPAGRSAPPRTPREDRAVARPAPHAGARPRARSAADREGTRRGRAPLPTDRRGPRRRAWPRTRRGGSTARASPDRSLRRTPRSQSVVFPIPEAPSSTSAAGPSTSPSRNASSRESSSTLPTTCCRLEDASGVIASFMLRFPFAQVKPWLSPDDPEC